MKKLNITTLLYCLILFFTACVPSGNKAEDVTQQNPDDASAYNNSGIAKSDLQDHTGAIADYNKAIQLKPDYADAYCNRGNAKNALQDHTGAITDYNKAIQLKPDFADAYNNRGIAKNDLQDKNGACLDWSKAGELGYSDAYINIKENCK